MNWLYRIRGFLRIIAFLATPTIEDIVFTRWLWGTAIALLVAQHAIYTL